MITNVKVLENIHMKCEAVAKDYQILPLHACQPLGLTSHSPGCPTLTSFQDFSFFDAWPQFSSSTNNYHKLQKSNFVQLKLIDQSISYMLQ